jgi:hypothetical protein
MAGQNLSTFSSHEHNNLRESYCSDICAELSALTISETENPLSFQNYLLLRMLSSALHAVEFHIAADYLPHSITIVV